MKTFLLIFAGENQGAVRVDEWENPAHPLKTIAIYALNYSGSVTIEASISNTPSDDDWFVVDVQEFTRPTTKERKYQNRFINSRDRYIWVRVTATEDPIGFVDRVVIR